MMQSQSAELVADTAKDDVGVIGTKKKILLVDDVKLFLELEKTFFQRKDTFEVLTAGNGKQALEVVESQRPDLVYMDLYMPEMNGDDCCRLIKASEFGKNIPVVMVTSAGSEEGRARCLAAGCDDVITKPVNRTHFLSVAKKYIEVHERKEPRYASHIKVSFGEHRDALASDYTVNFNTGGLFVSSSVLFPVDTRLFVELGLPGRDTAVSCQARVAWINGADNPQKRDLPVGMGLEYAHLDSEEARIIRDYIEKNGLSAEW